MTSAFEEEFEDRLKEPINKSDSNSTPSMMTEQQIREQMETERHLLGLIHDSQSKPYRVRAIQIHGAKNTNPKTLETLTEPILESKTLGEIIATTQHVAGKMQSLGAFKNVEVTLDTPNDNGRPMGIEGLSEVDVVLNVKERPRIWAKTGTEVGNYEGNMNASLNLRNALGSFETLEAHVSYGVGANIIDSNSSSPLSSSSLSSSSLSSSTSTTETPTIPNPSSSASAPLTTSTGTSYSLTYTKPILQPFSQLPDPSFSASIYKSNQIHKLISSHDQNLQGLSLKYRFPRIHRFPGLALANHEFGYDAVWRNIGDLTPNASWEVRQDSGNSLKSALSHTFSVDTRDDPMLASTGYAIRSVTEVAGLSGPPLPQLNDLALGMGGDVHHVKHESSLTKSFQMPGILDWLTVSTSLKVGGAVPLPAALSGYDASSYTPRTNIADRFLVGGPLSVRGFNMYGLGPRAPRMRPAGSNLPGIAVDTTGSSGYDSLGSDLYWTAGLSLLFPLRPAWRDKPVRGHWFLNAGSGMLLNDGQSQNSGQDWKNRLSPLWQSPSVSTGVGLAVRFSILRLEVNYCLPLVVTGTDSYKRGLQFGVGLQFL